MQSKPATLHMVCGKMAAGKSTLARKLEQAPNTVLVSEDTWLSHLFGDSMSSSTDYVTYAAKLRAAMGPHIAALLNAGVSVVLDFPANTVDSRAWMRSVLDQTTAQHLLHVLLPDDAICLARLKKRNASGDHAFAPTESQFYQFAKHFVAPTSDEHFNVKIYTDVF